MSWWPSNIAIWEVWIEQQFAHQKASSVLWSCKSNHKCGLHARSLFFQRLLVTIQPAVPRTLVYINNTLVLSHKNMLFLPWCQDGMNWIMGDVTILTHKPACPSICEPSNIWLKLTTHLLYLFISRKFFWASTTSGHSYHHGILLSLCLYRHNPIFQPIYGSAFTNAAIFLKCQKDDITDMVTEKMRCDGTEFLCSKVPLHCMEYSLVVKQSILTMMCIHFGWGASDGVKEGKLLFHEFDVQNRCICPHIRQLQGWHLNMAICM